MNRCRRKTSIMPQTDISTSQNLAPNAGDFAIPITEETDLGIAVLIAESEDGGYEPVGPVSTVVEAREIAASDLRVRMKAQERGQETFCPDVYAVWARGASMAITASPHGSTARSSEPPNVPVARQRERRAGRCGRSSRSERLDVSKESFIQC